MLYHTLLVYSFQFSSSYLSPNKSYSNDVLQLQSKTHVVIFVIFYIIDSNWHNWSWPARSKGKSYYFSFIFTTDLDFHNLQSASIASAECGINFNFTFTRRL